MSPPIPSRSGTRGADPPVSAAAWFPWPLALAADPSALALAALIGAGFYWYGKRRGHRAERNVLRSARSNTEREREAARTATTETGRAQSEFLAAMSHELRTPLNGSLGMITLLLDSELTRDQREFALTAKSSCSDLLGMIEDVLDFATLDTERMVLECEPFAPTKTIWDAVNAHAHKAAKRRLGLSFREFGELPQTVLGDEARLRQILDNLLENAIKFTHAGEVALRASVVSRERDSVRLAFELTDTGVGIPENKLDHVFDAFAQADQSSSRKYGGAGLGLVIVRRLLECMRGTIECESELDRGTTFRFELELGLPEIPQRPRDHHPVTSRGSRALVCSPHPRFTEAFRAQLEQLGFDVEAVSNQALALQRLREDAHTLFFVDDNIPVDELHQLRCTLLEDPSAGAGRMVLLHGPEDTQPHEGFHAHVERPTRPVLLRPFVINLCESLLEAPLPALPNDIEPSAAQRLLRKKRYAGRVLVVDDNDVNLRVVSALLETRGIEVERATGGFEALSMLRLVRCDLVLMDVQMPELDGIETTRRIRAGEAGPCLDVPIIALTAGDLAASRAACHEAGMADYIRKPLTEPDLDLVLGKWLREVVAAEE